MPGREFPFIQFIIGICLLGYAEVVCDLSLLEVAFFP
jgi:hypothetical protein